MRVNFSTSTKVINPHRDRLIAEFGSLRPDPTFVAPDIEYLFVLYINRCGSNYLSQALASTGLLNEAGEFFNADTVLAHSREQRLTSLQGYFAYLPQLVARNGWLACKLAIEHVDLLREAGILDVILPRSHFILLERQDRLAHAISRCIAWQNHRWTSEHPSDVRDECLIYSRQCIEQQLYDIELAKGHLYRFIAESGQSPIHFTYEAFVAAPQEYLDRIAARLRLPGLPLDRSRIRIERQSNRVNEAWRRRYLAGT